MILKNALMRVATKGQKWKFNIHLVQNIKAGSITRNTQVYIPAIKGSASGTIFRLMEYAPTRTSANQGNAASLLCVQCKSLKHVTTNKHLYILYMAESLYIHSLCINVELWFQSVF